MNPRTSLTRHRFATAVAVAALASAVIGLVGCRASAPESEKITRRVVYSSEYRMDLPWSIACADVIALGTVRGQGRPYKGVQYSKSARERLRSRGMSDDQINAHVEAVKNDIHTPITLEVEQSLKGEVREKTVEFDVLGGEVNGESVVVPGGGHLATLKPGRRIIVFLVYGNDRRLAVRCVYEINDGMASTDDEGRRDNMPLEKLLAVIEEHRNDPGPDKDGPIDWERPFRANGKAAGEASAAPSSVPATGN